jgi:hypothetical protein
MMTLGSGRSRHIVRQTRHLVTPALLERSLPTRKPVFNSIRMKTDLPEPLLETQMSLDASEDLNRTTEDLPKDPNRTTEDLPKDLNRTTEDLDHNKTEDHEKTEDRFKDAETIPESANMYQEAHPTRLQDREYWTRTHLRMAQW